jgi:hypothetical protein
MYVSLPGNSLPPPPPSRAINMNMKQACSANPPPCKAKPFSATSVHNSIITA